MEQFIMVEPEGITFDLEAIGRKLRTRSSPKAANLIEKLSIEAQTVARPRAGAKLSHINLIDKDKVEVDQVVLTSPLLVEKVDGLSRIFPYVVTEGQEMANWSNSYSGMDRIFANAFQHDSLRQVTAMLEKEIMEKYGITQVSAMNPGSLSVWAITQQKPLFQILGSLPEKLGVSLLPTFMMKPEHSGSGIFFQTDKKFFNCQLCPREDCPNRKVPYQAA